MVCMTRPFGVIAAVLGLGAAVSGCFQFAPDNEVGSFCAAPAGGNEVCVRSDQSPETAWLQAEANGATPIQMWAKWPSAVTLNELVDSSDELHAWIGDIDTVLAYLRTKDAESYRASMAGNVGELLRQVRDRLALKLANQPVDAVGRFEKAMTDKASVEKGPLVAEIAGDKQTMAAVQLLLDEAKTDAAPLSSAYASIVTQFATYRATEAAETASYVSLAQQASAASLADLPGVEQAIVTAAQDASSAPVELTMAAMTLSAQLQMFEITSQAAIAPHADFLASHGAVLPDMTSDAQRSLNAMLGYMQQRVTRSDATATSLLNGIAMRAKALAVLDASPSSAVGLAQSQALAAKLAFHADASAQLVALSEAPPSSRKLGLPYLAARYDQLTKILQMRAFCASPSSSWREAGCGALRRSFGTAATDLRTTLPALIATGLSTLRASGVDSRLLDAAQSKLDAGNVKGAALAYDAAVRSTEGT